MLPFGLKGSKIFAQKHLIAANHTELGSVPPATHRCQRVSHLAVLGLGFQVGTVILDCGSRQLGFHSC